jgi:hypothetical protein
MGSLKGEEFLYSQGIVNFLGRTCCMELGSFLNDDDGGGGGGGDDDDKEMPNGEILGFEKR